MINWHPKGYNIILLLPMAGVTVSKIINTNNTDEKGYSVICLPEMKPHKHYSW